MIHKTDSNNSSFIQRNKEGNVSGDYHRNGGNFVVNDFLNCPELTPNQQCRLALSE